MDSGRRGVLMCSRASVSLIGTVTTKLEAASSECGENEKIFLIRTLCGIYYVKALSPLSIKSELSLDQSQLVAFKT